jgi:hypothetical protein
VRPWSLSAFQRPKWCWMGWSCLLITWTEPLRFIFVQIHMISIVGEVVEVGIGVSSASVFGSLCKETMDLEVTGGSPDVGIGPRKGRRRLRPISQSRSRESGDRDDGHDLQPPLGMDSVGDDSHHPPGSYNQG